MKSSSERIISFMLILMTGLPGTGKSALARELAWRIGGHVLNKDVVREALFGPNHVEYSTEQDDLVIHLMLESAAWLLSRDPELRVFLDGRTFSRAEQIEDVIRFAESVRTPWRIIKCVCRDETALERLKQDATRNLHPAQNRAPGLYHDLKSRFEPITREKTVIDTDEPFETYVSQALRAVRA